MPGGVLAGMQVVCFVRCLMFVVLGVYRVCCVFRCLLRVSCVLCRVDVLMCAGYCVFVCCIVCFVFRVACGVSRAKATL